MPSGALRKCDDQGDNDHGQDGEGKGTAQCQAEALVEHPTSHWLPLLRAADAVYAPVNWPDTVADDPQIRAIKALVEHEHPVAGHYRQPVHPIRFSETPAALHRHAPVLDEHRAEILTDFGIGLDELA